MMTLKEFHVKTAQSFVRMAENKQEITLKSV
jgi:hypothetical protein